MKKIALSQSDWHVIKKFLVGGGALGAGAGLATSLANYLKALKDDAEEKNTQDDETLFVNVVQPEPVKKASEEDPSYLRGGIAIAGGTLSALGAYALVRKMYQEMKRRELQAELDRSQDVYLTSLRTQAEEAASAKKERRRAFLPLDKAASEGKPMSTTEAVLSAPTALTLLLALGSGVVANQVLKKTFPVPNKPTRLTPRRVVIRDAEPMPEDNEGVEVEQLKEAALSEASEYLVDFVASTIPHSDPAGMVKAAAESEGYTAMVAGLCNHGPTAVVELSKCAAASNHPVEDALRRQLAVSLLCKSAALSGMVNLMAAAEYIELNPGMFKAASALPEPVQDALVGIVACVRCDQRAVMFKEAFDHMFEPSEMAKSAYAIGGDVLSEAVLEKILEKSLGEGDKPEDVDDAKNDTDDNVDFDIIGSSSKAFANRNKDLIDQVLSYGEEGKPFTVVQTRDSRKTAA